MPQRVVYAPLKAGAETVLASPAPSPAPAPTHISASDPLLEATRARLAGAGFEVLVHPKSKHAIDLAAERSDGDIQRIIVRLPDFLSLDVAKQVLAASRALDVDLALVVCPEADPAARRAFIATKARWLTPDDLAELHL